MLIPSSRYTKQDLEIWKIREEEDIFLSQTNRLKKLEERALNALRLFWEKGFFFVGVSWGKDSVVIAHLSIRLHAENIRPKIIWFPAGKIENPDCILVRDAFLSKYSCDYEEIITAPIGAIDEIYGHDGAQKEFERASKQAGLRYASGVRAAESGIRTKRMKRFGENSKNTCAPIGFWPTEYVFAYLYKYDLPIHPIYACSLAGFYDRNYLRVGTLGGKRGRGFGRFEYESIYYSKEMKELGFY